MAINKKLIHFESFTNFNSLKLSANKENKTYTIGVGGPIQSGDPDILYQSIVYIKDTKQQWTHGLLYNETITKDKLIALGVNLTSVDIDEEVVESPEMEYATKGYVDKALAEHTTPEAELVVRIKQDGDNAELSNVKAKVTYGSKEVELSSGAKVLVPVGEDVTVEFPKLEGYKRPDTMKFTMSENGNTVNAVYKGALVTLNVSTYDGASADGQVVTVQKTVTIDCTPDYDRIDELGVAIMDIYGKFYRDADEWIAAGRPVPNGIAVSDGTHRFCIAMQNIDNFDGVKNMAISAAQNYPTFLSVETDQQQSWGLPLLPPEEFGELEEIGLEIFTPAVDGISEELFIRDAGVVNNPEAVEVLRFITALRKIAPLALCSIIALEIGYDVSMQCAFHTFPNSSQGYLASCGEWILASTFSKKIDYLFNSIGGKPLGFDQLPLYWTDTLYGSGYVCACLASDGYIMSETTGEMEKIPAGSIYPAGQLACASLRPFCTLEPKHQTITTAERLVVKNGKVTFNTPYEAVNTVVFSDKNGYITPERMEFQASGSSDSKDVMYGEHTSMTIDYHLYAGQEVSVVFHRVDDDTEIAMHDISSSGSQLLTDVEEGTEIYTRLTNYSGNVSISGDTTFTFVNGGTAIITITEENV